MRLAHVNLTARDLGLLCRFYTRVFGFEDLRPRRTLAGPAVERGNGLPGVAIASAWLGLPGGDGPFLEILSYASGRDRPRPRIDEPGWGHVAFTVPDIAASAEAIVREGGAWQGEITDFGTPEAPVLLVYMRDPEGNVIELEQG